MRGMPEIRTSMLNELEIRSEIEARKQLQSQMVGNLYPSIIQDEIEELKQMVANLKYRNCNHKFYTDVDFTSEEIGRRNILAVLVIEDKKLICKRCGYEQP